VPSECIDDAVIEKCSASTFSIKVVELDASWSDLGAWGSVWQLVNKDEQGKITSGDILLGDNANSLVYASNRLVSAGAGVKM
jgi:mannose-1-phosphate guanylyltransferase/mannose-6-phosphate isomerase